MRILFIFTGILILVLTFAEDIYKDYTTYKVIRAHPKTSVQYEVLHEISLQGDIDFWTDLRKGEPVDIMLSPVQLNLFSSLMASHRISFETLIPDVGRIILKQRLASRIRRLNKLRPDDEMNWDEYHRLDVINSWLKKLEVENPNLVNIETIGQSAQGRNISLVKISTGGSGKAGVYIDGNIHAREWISITTVTYVINALVGLGNDDLLKSYDFYIVPTVNPDGYEYTHNWDRMWRKTMVDHDKGQICFGVDGNRNWDYMWGGDGGSPDECHYKYQGTSPFSEPETSAIQKYIANTHANANWTYFITVHNFGQYVLLPYGDGSRPSDYDELLSKANAFVSAAYDVDGEVYVAGNSREISYITSGTSSDWAKGVANIKYSYTVELRDKGDYGFIIPPSLIKVIGQEFWAGLKAMLKT